MVLVDLHLPDQFVPIGRHEHFRGISCEKSLFYAKKIIVFTITEGGAKNVGVFRVKNHDFTPEKHIFFPILGGP
jgi:hypothetical protein